MPLPLYRAALCVVSLTRKFAKSEKQQRKRRRMKKKKQREREREGERSKKLFFRRTPLPRIVTIKWSCT